jgi:DNA-binding GntR family transcriptional regulator
MLERKESVLPQKTVTEGIVREMRERLLSGQIKGGEPLRQEQLANEFGVSRIPIREALLQLGAEGLVVFTPHKGAVATRLSIEEADELFHLRALLETDVFSHAFSKLTSTHLDAAEKALARYDRAIEAGTDADLWGKMNWEFHEILFEPAQLPRTVAIIKNLHTSTDRYQRFFLLTGGVVHAETEHRLILTLCRAGDEAGAMTAMRDHILSVHKRVRHFLLTPSASQIREPSA